jgi:hypothetical protein
MAPPRFPQGLPKRLPPRFCPLRAGPVPSMRRRWGSGARGLAYRVATCNRTAFGLTWL